MTPIRQGKPTEKVLRPLGDRSVELGLGVCFQQKWYPRVGWWLRVHRQRAAKWASPIWIVRLPAASPQQAKSALAGAPMSPLAHADRLRRGEIFPPPSQQRARRGPRFCAAQLI